jgi:uncharacterized membrane protein (GlpM family)
MRYAFDIIIFIAVALLAIQNQLFAAGVLAVFFTYRVSALPLVALAIGIDGFFGAFYHLPMFSIVTLVWYLVSELLRPRISLKQTSYG